MSGNISDCEDNGNYLAHLNDMYALQVLPAILCLAVLMLVGIVGNSLVLYIYIAKFKTTTVSIFISALAILDLFNCLVNIPSEIVVLRYNFTFGNSPFCKIKSFMNPFLSLASLCVLVAVATDRFKKICRPYQKQTTIFIGKVAIAICIIIAAVVTAPAAFLYGPRVVNMSDSVTGTVCSVSDKARQTMIPTIYNSVSLMLFLVTSCAFIAVYFMIWRQISKQRKFRKTILHQKYSQIKGNMIKDRTTMENTPISNTDGPTHLNSVSSEHFNVGTGTNKLSPEAVGSPGQENSVCQSDKDGSMPEEIRSLRDIQPCKARRDKGVQRTTLMLFLTTVVFILSFLPFLGLITASAVNKQLIGELQGAQVPAFHLFVRSFFVNSVSNPFIYSLCSDRFRRQMKLLFKKT